MTDKGLILGIDQGTTGTTALLSDSEGNVLSHAYREILQIFPKSGWIDQKPDEIFQSCLEVVDEAVAKAAVPYSAISALGITNQRETTIVWDRLTGYPVCNAVVWQCRRTAGLCDRLKEKGMESVIKVKTGLPIDAYFSATKIRWILDSLIDGQQRAERGELLFGTVDSWLIWNLTKGNVHVTDFSNASRTMLFNIKTLRWDPEILDCLNIPEIMLPKVITSSQVYGETANGIFNNSHIKLAGLAGDQQAALFGQACYQAGMTKSTYGTGTFVLMNTGRNLMYSKNGLITTIAWSLKNEVSYAIEGSVFISGAAVQWLRDGLGVISNASEIESLATGVPNNGGVYFVPAFVGLGAPYWDMYARGTIVGLTRGITKGHLARATLEAIGFQTRDIVDAMIQDTGIKIPVLRVDGGGSSNNFLMQFQSDILGIPVERAQITDSTALGATYLAGLAIGLWRDTHEITQHWKSDATFEPKISIDERETSYLAWHRAVERARNWIM
jgi:glycerol kinase